jgi:protocatechuate 3,4-dioxygenase beta subunit
MILPALGLAVLLQTPPVPPPPRPVTPGQIGQLPSRDQNQRLPMVGKSSISGTVLSENGQPLKGARVSASGSAIGRSVTTDATGAFVFDKLPEGRYTVSASRPRYLSGTYGQKRPNRAGTPVQIADGEERKNLTITLFSAGVITGAVLAEDGEPVQGAQVRALRYSMTSGIRRLQTSNSVSTDDRGAFRLFGLTPGEYIVAATTNQLDMGLQINAEMAVAIERAAAASNGGGYSFSNGVMTLADGSRIEQPSPVAMAPTYYPGSTQPGAAVSVTVRGGEERTGVDITMQKVQTATVSGTVISGAGPLPSNISLQMQSNAEGGQGLPLPSGRVEPDGRFTLRAVPPGQYTILARATTTTRVTLPVSGVAAGSGVVTEVQRVTTLQNTTTGRVNISVDGQPVSGVVISLDAGRSLTGRVLFEGGTPPDMSRTRLMAQLSPVQTAMSFNIQPPTPMQIAQDGTFKIIGISPGQYTLRVSGVQGWSIKSSIVEGRDSLDFPFDVDGQDIANAIVTMAPPPTPAELSGFITDQRSQPVTDYTIVVFSADQRFWTPGSRRILTARPATDGKYMLRGLQPGDYQIAALSDLEPGTQYDPELLKSMLVASARVTIGEGAKVTQDLRITSQLPVSTGDPRSRTSSRR